MIERSIPLEELGRRTLVIGRAGESGALCLRIDVSAWLREYPQGRASLAVLSPKDVLYAPVGARQVGSDMVWVVMGSDTQDAGVGAMELTLTGASGEIIKSVTAVTCVHASLTAAKEVQIPDWGTPALSEAARRLESARKIALSGDARGQTYFDGSEDVQIQTTVAALSNEDLEEMLK